MMLRFFAVGVLLLLQTTSSDAFQPSTRRDFFQWSSSSILVGANLVLPEPARAVGEGTERMVFRQKPTAPVGALLPAIQQRLLLEAALEVANQKDLEKLRTILGPLDDAFPANSDVQLLKLYNPARVLRGDLTRATLNLYQTNLNYNNLNPTEAFTITDPEWKKSYIRANNGLPDLKRVIGADLDMRQLLRNQVQLKLDDASAELYAEDCNVPELQSLLKDAAVAFDQWLDRIRAGDVQDALKAAFQGETVKVYEPYAAGFLPISR